MAEENARVSAREMGRWVALALLFLALLAAYFVYSPRVPPAITPVQSAESP
jgi:hypothetical protein